MRIEDLSDADLAKELELANAQVELLKRNLRELSERLAAQDEEVNRLAHEMGRRDGLRQGRRMQDLPVGSVAEVLFREEKWVVEVRGFSCGGHMVTVTGEGPNGVMTRGAAPCEDFRVLDVFPVEVPE